MALLCSATVGTALLLIWSGLTAAVPWHPATDIRSSRRYTRLQECIVLSGVRGLTVVGLVATCGACGVLGLAVATWVTGVVVLGLMGGLVSGYVPYGVVSHQARAHVRKRREAWPDAVDHVSSAVRAGLSIPEALRQLAQHGPEVLRQDFAAFARHDAAHGNFDASLDVLKASLADPAADRLIESLRLARNVGGSDVGRLLRTLSSFLREDAATRTELAAKQSWTVSAARLALAAPWLALLVVGFRGEGFAAYRTSTGIAVLIGGAVVSWLAYAAMRAIGRLPVEERVMA